MCEQIFSIFSPNMSLSE